jgi:hypothetical protein
LLGDNELPAAQALFISEVWGIFKLTETTKKTKVWALFKGQESTSFD